MSQSEHSNWQQLLSSVTHVSVKYFVRNVNTLYYDVVGNYQRALETYRKIHEHFPENLECKFSQDSKLMCAYIRTYVCI